MIRMKELSPRQRAAAMAWLVAGEGSITIQRQTMTDGKPIPVASVWVGNTNRDMLEQVREAYGGVIACYSKPISSVHRQCYYWRITKQEQIIAVLEEVLPYLPLKREQAKSVLAFCRSRVKRRYLSNPHRNYNDRELGLWDYVRFLYARGNVPEPRRQ